MIEKLQQTGERLVMLRARLKARKGRPGYDRNVAELEEEIARLEKATLDIGEQAKQKKWEKLRKST